MRSSLRLVLIALASLLFAALGAALCAGFVPRSALTGSTGSSGKNVMRLLLLAYDKLGPVPAGLALIAFAAFLFVSSLLAFNRAAKRRRLGHSGYQPRY